MKKEQDKDLDDLFKKKLEDPDYFAGYREEDWGALEKMLDKKKRGMIYWLPVLGSVAALLLLFFGWWLFTSKPAENGASKLQAIVKQSHPQNDTGSAGPVHPSQLVSTASSLKDSSAVGSGRQPVIGQTAPFLLRRNKHRMHQVKPEEEGQAVLASRAPAFSHDTNNAANNQHHNFNRQGVNVLSAISHFNVQDQQAIDARAVTAVNLLSANPVSTKSPRENLKSLRSFRPQYAITVLAAPDINGVSSFQQSRGGTNVGLLFSAELFNKISLSTGAVYASKGYNIAFQNYHTLYNFKVDPSSVTADCKMLDLPLNVEYRFYNKHQNKLSFGTGLSSYIMLKENYQFNYAASAGGYPNWGTTGPASYSVPGSSGYYLGILNLNATYTRQLNSKVGVAIEPYLKLPLANVGYSQVRLQSTGVAVGLTWNLNSLTKP